MSADVGGHGADVVARHQRGRHQCPESEVRTGFGEGQAGPPDHEHVRVVPVPGTGLRGQRGGDVEDVADAHRVAVGVAVLPDVEQVFGGAPQVGDLPPVVLVAGDGVVAVGVDAVDDRPPGGTQGVAHQGEAADLLVTGA